uniref:NADH-ubiquinone oxidoreductase chain 4 n=1 Tax=Phalacridae gen. sp. MJ-2020 TaxID=2762523 RepID=A0A7G7MU52_9CUCU|nr:NADH dehydrogenase subunit 4 [Phalacridae gen. sp. MJ-2020]
MMKYLLFLLFLMPLSFLNFYWLIQFLFLMISFIYLIDFSFNYQLINISYFLGMDLLSYNLILLSFWICSLMIMASEKIFKFNNYYQLFLMIMIIMMISLYLTFSSLNLFIFYVFFEISLIPTLILIIGWGYQPERIEAGLYLLFYTLLVSLPMMISIFYVYYMYNSLDFFFIMYQKIIINNYLIYFCMILIFMVKFPMYFVHLWLPKAHVEAPISGSMILAGIMLKLGGYGLMRLMPMFINMTLKLNYIFISISMVGGVIVSLICIRQSDMKSLIAYSSVAHMGMVLGSLFTMNFWGLWGSLILMIAHGLCSSGLFCLANIIYERTLSRSMYLNKGLINFFPSLSLWWFLFCSCNMAAPPSLNLMGEIFLLTSLISFNFILMIYLAFLSFFSAVYSLYLFSYTQHGMMSMNNYYYILGMFREYLLLLLHYLPLNLLFLKSELLSLWI